MGAAADVTYAIFPAVYFRGAGGANGRNQRNQRAGERGFYRRAFRICIFILEHIFDVLLQFEADGRSDSGMVRVRDSYCVYLPAGNWISAEFDSGEQQGSWDSAADIQRASEVSGARRGESGVLAVEYGVWRNVEVEFEA